LSGIADKLNEHNHGRIAFKRLTQEQIEDLEEIASTMSTDKPLPISITNTIHSLNFHLGEIATTIGTETKTSSIRPYQIQHLEQKPIAPRAQLGRSDRLLVERAQGESVIT
jgi:predicted XRE-type DNA-binding protein